MSLNKFSDSFDNSFEEHENMRQKLVRWAVERIYLQTLNLNAFAITCVIRMGCFASLAKSLLVFYRMEEANFCSRYDVLRTYSIVAYGNVFKYLTTRYRQKTQEILNGLLDSSNTSFIPSPQDLTPHSRLSVNRYSQYMLQQANQSSLLSEEEQNAWDDVLIRHLEMCTTEMLPSLLKLRRAFEEKRLLADFHLQVGCLIELGGHIAVELLAVGGCELRKRAFEMVKGVVERHRIEDKPTQQSLWQLLFLLVEQSDFSPFYLDFLKAVLNEIVNEADFNSSQALFANLTDRNQHEVFSSLLTTIGTIFNKISMSFTVMVEMQTPTDNEFMLSICAVVFRLAKLLRKIQHWEGVAEPGVELVFIGLLTQLFELLCTVVKQFQKEEAKHWSCIDSLAEFVQTALKDIFSKSIEERMGMPLDGASTQMEPHQPQQRAQHTKKQKDRVQANYASNFERLHNSLLMLSKSLVDDRFELNTLNQGFRDFQLNTSLLARRLEVDQGHQPEPALDQHCLDDNDRDLNASDADSDDAEDDYLSDTDNDTDVSEDDANGVRDDILEDEEETEDSNASDILEDEEEREKENDEEGEKENEDVSMNEDNDKEATCTLASSTAILATSDSNSTKKDGEEDDKDFYSQTQSQTGSYVGVGHKRSEGDGNQYEDIVGLSKKMRNS